MGGRFVFIPDQAGEPSAERVELFAGVRDVLNVNEAADALNVCAQTVRRLIASGELESVHVGRAVRVPKTALVDFITRQGVSA